MADSVLRASPPEIRLTFSEAPEATFTRIRLFGPAGPIALGPLEIRPGNVAAARVPTTLEPGRYRVEWSTAGDDGHPVAGRFSFALENESALVPPGGDSGAGLPIPTGATQDSFSTHGPGMAAGGESDPFAGLAAVLRWLTLMGAIATIGTVTFRYTVLARVSLEVDRDIRTDYLPSVARGAALVGLLAAGLLIATGAARLLLQSVAVNGADAALDSAVLVPMITQTNWGRAWTTQLIGAAVAVAAFAWVRRPGRDGWLLAMAGCLGIAVGLSVASHAAVVERLSGPSMAANVIHTTAAAGWLGNLLLIFTVGFPNAWRLDRDDRWTVVRDIVHAFSPAALAFGGTAAATGIFMAWTHVGSFAALTDTDYGNVLMIKVGLLAVTAMIGAYNWLRVRPRLGDRAAARTIRRTAGVELAFAALVLAVTAVLVALPLPM